MWIAGVVRTPSNPLGLDLDGFLFSADCQSAKKAETTEAAPRSANATAKPRLRWNMHKFISPPDWLSPIPSTSSREPLEPIPARAASAKDPRLPFGISRRCARHVAGV